MNQNQQNNNQINNQVDLVDVVQLQKKSLSEHLNQFEVSQGPNHPSYRTPKFVTIQLMEPVEYALAFQIDESVTLLRINEHRQLNIVPQNVTVSGEPKVTFLLKELHFNQTFGFHCEPSRFVKHLERYRPRLEENGNGGYEIVNDNQMINNGNWELPYEMEPMPQELQNDEDVIEIPEDLDASDYEVMGIALEQIGNESVTSNEAPANMPIVDSFDQRIIDEMNAYEEFQNRLLRQHVVEEEPWNIENISVGDLSTVNLESENEN